MTSAVSGHEEHSVPGPEQQLGHRATSSGEPVRAGAALVPGGSQPHARQPVLAPRELPWTPAETKGTLATFTEVKFHLKLKVQDKTGPSGEILLRFFFS